MNSVRVCILSPEYSKKLDNKQFKMCCQIFGKDSSEKEHLPRTVRGDCTWGILATVAVIKFSNRRQEVEQYGQLPVSCLKT